MFEPPEKKRLLGPRMHNAAAPFAIKASLKSIDRFGTYRIEAHGYSLISRFPENRIAKALFDAGHRGSLEVHGLAQDGRQTILRASYDIEKMAARQMTEDARGIRFVPWTEKSLGALKQAIKGQPFVHRTLNDSAHADGAAKTQNGSMGKGFQSRKPVSKPTTKPGPENARKKQKPRPVLTHGTGARSNPSRASKGT